MEGDEEASSDTESMEGSIRQEHQDDDFLLQEIEEALDESEEEEDEDQDDEEEQDGQSQLKESVKLLLEEIADLEAKIKEKQDQADAQANVIMKVHYSFYC